MFGNQILEPHFVDLRTPLQDYYGMILGGPMEIDVYGIDELILCHSCFITKRGFILNNKVKII